MLKKKIRSISSALIASSFIFGAISADVWAQGDHNKHGYFGCSHELDVPCSTRIPFKHEKRKNVVTELYEGLIYPHSKDVLADPTAASHLFEQSVVKGRVTPAGQYSDFEGAIEYFYGLALTPSSRVDDIKVRSIVASGDKVAVEVDLHFCNSPYTGCNPDEPVGEGFSTIRQTGFYTFNANDKIISFDLTILNLGQYADIEDPAARAQNIIGVCTVLTTAHFNVVSEQVVYQGTCTEYFDGADDFPEGFPVTEGDALTNCITYMNSIPYGTWDQPASDTFTCRSLHSLLTPLRPLHCMHVSVEGGGKCVDKEYSEFFETEF